MSLHCTTGRISGFMCLVQVEHMTEQIRTDIEEMIGRLQEVMQSDKNRRMWSLVYRNLKHKLGC